MIKKTNLPFLIFFTLIWVTQVSFCQVTLESDKDKEESDAESIIIDAKKNVFIGKYDVAISKLEGLLNKDRTNAIVAFELAKVYIEKNSWTDAQRYMEQAIRNEPKNVYFLEYYTSKLMNYPYDAERERYFSDLINLSSKKVAYYDQYIDYLLTNKKYALAKPVLSKMTTTFGESEKILQRSFEVCNLTNCKEKESIITKLIAKDKNNVGYLKLLAQFHLEKGNQNEAQKVYEQVKQINPNDTEANLAILKTADTKKNAESAYLRTIMPLIKNQNIPIDEKIKELMPYLKDFVEKNDTSYLDELADIGQNLSLTHPTEAKAQAFYGDVLYARHKYKGAVQQYQKTLKLNDRNYAVWENLMRSLDILADYTELEKVAKSAIDYFPTRVESYIILSKTLVIQNKVGDAKDYIEEGIMVSGGNPKYAKDLNVLKDMVKDGLTTEEKFTQGIKTENVNPLELEILGDKALKDGNINLAFEYYRKALLMGHEGKIRETLIMRGIKFPHEK
jgi:tetratricopeptide (TPR) repeat protein